MKTVILSILLILISVIGISESKVNKSARCYYVLDEITVTPDKEWNLLVEAIWNHESAGGRILVGDNGRARGIFHIHPIMVDHINKVILKENRYSYEDRMDPIKSREMFELYQEFWNPDKDFETAARIWNGGPRGMNKHQTEIYWSHIRDRLNNNT